MIISTGHMISIVSIASAVMYVLPCFLSTFQLLNNIWN